MIAKAIKGRGFRGVLNYDLNQEKGEILDTNMSGANAREMAQEFGVIRQLRPNLNKAVLHVSLSAAIGEHLTNEQWQEIGHKYLNGMGLDNNQFVMTRHTDTDHEHIHIIANRIQFNGEVTSDSNDYRRQEVIMREIERDYGLQSVAPSTDAKRRAPSKGLIELEKRTGEIPAKTQLQTIIDKATADKPPFSAFVNRLHSADVSILPSGKTGTPQGISFEIQGKAFKGSDLGKPYGWKQLQARVDYDQNRDQGIIDQLRQDPSPINAISAELNTRQLLDQPAEQVIKTRPDLKETFEYLDSKKRQLEERGETEHRINVIMDESKKRIAQMIDEGKYPQLQIKEPEQKPKPQKTPKRRDDAELE